MTDQNLQVEQNLQIEGDPEKAKKLYNNLVKAGLTTTELGSQDEFLGAISKKESATKIYNGLVGMGFTKDELGDQNEFLTTFSSEQKPIKQAPPQQPPKQVPAQKEKPAFDVSIFESRDFYQPSKPVSTEVAKVRTPETMKQVEQSRATKDVAIESTVDRRLKNKGLKAAKNSPLYQSERKKVLQAIDDGDAVVSKNPVTGEPVLAQTTGFFESLWNNAKYAVENEEEAADFVNNMTTEQRLEYIYKKEKEVKISPEGYVGEVAKASGKFGPIEIPIPEDVAYVLGGGAKLAGGVAPFMGKATIGGLAGAALVAAAPVTGGASLAGVPALMAATAPAVGAFTTTVGDMANQGGRDEVMRRFYLLKKQSPNVPDIEILKEAEKGLISGEIVGGITNMAFMGAGKALVGGLASDVGKLTSDIGKKALSEESKSVVGQYIKSTLRTASKVGEKVSKISEKVSKTAPVKAMEAAKKTYIGEAIGSGVKMGAIISGAEAVKEAEAGMDDKRLRLSNEQLLDNATKSFVDNATVGFILHAITTLPKLPGQIKSAFKNVLAKEDPAALTQILKNNEVIGNIPEGTTERVMTDVLEYSNALGKTSDGLDPVTQTSVAGLIQKRDKLTSEMASKDPTQVESYRLQIEALDEQIKRITESNDPFEYEVNAVGERLSEKAPIDKVYRVEYFDTDLGKMSHKLFPSKTEGDQFQSSLTSQQNKFGSTGYYEKYEGGKIEGLELPKEEKITTYDTENITRIPSEVGIGEKPIEAQPIEGGGTQEISGGRDIQKEGEGEKPKEVTSEEADIEKRRKEELDALIQTQPIEVFDEKGNLIATSDKAVEINAKYDAELKALKEKQQAELPQAEKPLEAGKKAGEEAVREDFPEEQSNVRTEATQKLLNYLADTLGVERIDMKKGGYIDWIKEQTLAVQGNKGAENLAQLELGLNAPKQVFDRITKYKEANEPIRKEVSGTVQPVSEVPEGQKIEEGLQPSTRGVGERETERTAPVLSSAGIKRADAKKTYEHMRSMDDPLDAYGMAKRWLANGNKVSVESFSDEVSGRIRSKGEAKIKTTKDATSSEFTDSKSKKTIDKAAHEIWDDLREDQQESITDQDIRNALIDLMQSYSKRLDLAKDYILEYDPEEAAKKFYERDIEENKAEFEREQKALEDWYNDIAESDFEVLQDKEFVNQLVKEYERDYPELFEPARKAEGGAEKVTEAEKGRGVEEISGAEGVREEGAVEPIEPAKPTERAREEEKPKQRRQPGRFEEKANVIADKIRKSELPSFLKADTEGAKKAGASAEELKEMLADAVVTMGKLMDKGVEFSQALKTAVKGLVKSQGEENREAIEKGFESYYRENVGAKAEEVKGAEPPKPPIPEKETSPESNNDMTKMANAINDAYIEGKFGVDALDSILAKLQETDIKDIYEKVKSDIKSGKIDVKKTKETIITSQRGTERDQAVLLYELAELKGKEDALEKSIIEENDPKEKARLQSELMNVRNEMMDNAQANRMLGRTASTIFRLRQAWVNRDADLAQMEQQYKSSKGIKELSKQQEKEIKNAYDRLREAKAKMNKLKQELNNALEKEEKSKKEAQLIKELNQKANEIKKKARILKTSERIDASKKRIEDARERLRRIRSNMNDITRVVPETAYEISKIAAEKVYQGIVKFDELVRNVYEDVKDIFPEWTEKDVRKHLLPDVDIEAYYEGREVLPKSAESVKEKLNAYQLAQSEYAKLMFEWQKDRASDIMQNKPFKERMIDNILRWQRFAVLSYPSTMVKLAGVVGHQIALKPLKFGYQYLQNLILKGVDKGAAEKQQIFGKPSTKALARYYSSFIRNFSAKNLKEQFSGIDTKEMLYGKQFMYDEWAAAKGFLEIPGRSHGYIKSFIKNPEFEFAHEQLTSWYMNKMEKISQELENPNLSKERREKLEEEYKKNDVTSEEVLDKINSMSLNHAKWSIMMNDNKFVEKFRQWTNSIGGAGGAIIKSELPIVKIPTNYVGRVFAYKYGLIRSIIGKKGEAPVPGIIEIIAKGSKDLSPEQADLLGKSLTLGTIGASFFALGWANRNNIKKNDDGSFEINGVHVSKKLVHSPEIEVILNGAEMANKYNESKEFLKSWMDADWDVVKNNPFFNMLNYGFLPNVATALINKRGEDKRMDKISDAVSKKISDMAIPGFSKELAKWTDVEGGGIQPMGEPIKRKPQGTNLEKFTQTIEMGIPGLRQRVPSVTGLSESDTKKFSPLLGIGIDLPKLGERKTLRLKITINRPDGKMTESEYDKFSKLANEYSNKYYERLMLSKKSRIDRMRKIKESTSPSEQAEYNKYKREIENNMQTLHQKAIKEAKAKLKLH